MRTTWTFGKLWGIPLRIHINWLVTALLVTWSLSIGYFPQFYPHQSRAVYWIAGLLTSLLFFASVLLHELGHAMVAIQENVPVKSITLFIFGGVAQITKEPPTPTSEFRIVVAGPFTSLLLAAFFATLAWIPAMPPVASGTFAYLGYINLVLAVFNMIPGFPLDGGRILRSILWKLMNNFQKATRWATHVALVIASLFMAGGLLLVLRHAWFDGIWVGFIGLYLLVTTRESYKWSLESNPEFAQAAAARSLKPEQLVITLRQPTSNMLHPAFILLDIADRNDQRRLLSNGRRLHGDGSTSPDHIDYT